VAALDNGSQPLSWVNAAPYGAAFAQPTRCPLGPSDPILAIVSSEDEMLCAARHLVDATRVTADRACTSVAYLHIQFATHEIVLCEGLWAENFLFGPDAINGIPDASRAELLALNTELA
jgi:hypothetical protein